MIKLPRLVFIVLCMLYFSSAKAQVPTQLEDIGGSNGNTTAGFKENISKNLFTGTASVGVPFYNYSINGRDLGVKMSYSTEGIKVDRIASNVGLGWEIFTGGYIERTIRGSEDDINLTTSCTYTDYSTSPPTDYPPMAFTHTGYWYASNNDEEADFFTANIGGKTFSFMFSKTGDLLTIPDNTNVQIKRYIDGILVTGPIPVTTTCTSGNLSFTITDELGNEFSFIPIITQNLTDPHMFGASACGPAWKSTNSWRLSKVKAYEGEEVNFVYDPYGTLNVTFANVQQFREKNNNWGRAKSSKEVFCEYKRLLKIEYPNNVDVVFDYDYFSHRCDLGSDPRLTKITVKERNTTTGIPPIAYSFNFNQSYFKSPDYNTLPSLTAGNDINQADAESQLMSGSIRQEQLRLRLNSIDMVGTDNTTRSYFKFAYSSVALPERLKGARDFYGFANKTTSHPWTNASGESFDLTIQEHNIVGSYVPSIGANLDPAVAADIEYVKACNLISVTNQFGGITEFSYKLASSGSFLTTGKVGGLVIDYLKTYDGYSHQNDVQTSFTYTDGEQFITAEGSFTYDFWTKTKHWPTPTTQWYTMYSNFGNVLNSALNGPNFGFKTVEEKVTSGSIQQSRSTYQFMGKIFENYLGTTSSNLYTPDFTTLDYPFNQPFDIAPFTNKQYLRSWGIGLLKEKNDYDANNRIVATINYYYDITAHYESSNFKGKHSLADGFTYPDWYCSDACEGDFSTHYIGDVYYPFSGHIVLTRIMNRNWYSDAGNIQTNSYFATDARGNITASSTENSKGEIVKSNYYYNYNFSSGGTAISHLNTTSNLSRLIYSDKWKKVGGIDKLIGLSATGLEKIAGTNIIRPKYSYRLATPASTPITGSYTLDMNSASTGAAIASFKMESAVTKFDDKGYPIETSDLNGIGLNNCSASIFDNEKGYVLAEAKNAKYDEIAYCGFESNYLGVSSPYIKGNLFFDPAFITTPGKMLGRYGFHNSASSGHWLTFAGTLTNTFRYTVSFWATSAGPTVSVTDGGKDAVGNPTYASMYSVASYTVPGSSTVWNLYKGTFTYGGPYSGTYGFYPIEIKCECYMDEVKLYPEKSMMTTHNYLPLVGKAVDVDVNDKIATYAYDGFGNITIIRDHNGNIISKTITSIQQP